LRLRPGCYTEVIGLDAQPEPAGVSERFRCITSGCVDDEELRYVRFVAVVVIAANIGCLQYQGVRACLPVKVAEGGALSLSRYVVPLTVLNRGRAGVVFDALMMPLSAQLYEAELDMIVHVPHIARDDNVGQEHFPVSHWATGGLMLDVSRSAL